MGVAVIHANFEKDFVAKPRKMTQKASPVFTMQKQEVDAILQTWVGNGRKILLVLELGIRYSVVEMDVLSVRCN